MDLLPDYYIGESRPWPDGVRIMRGSKSKTYVPDKVAHKVTYTDDGIVGRCTCNGCDRTVSRTFVWCPWCGARFEDDE